MNPSNSDTNAQEQVGDNSAHVLLDLENLIKSHIAAIDKAKGELKKQREMITSALENDETYRLHNEEAKKTAKIKAQTKFQIMQQPANKALTEKTHELSGQIREQSTALSDYLREYGRMSGSNEIETDDGEVREIVYVAKLVKKSSKK
jgi:xylose isomerase